MNGEDIDNDEYCDNCDDDDNDNDNDGVANKRYNYNSQKIDTDSWNPAFWMLGHLLFLS